MLLPVLAIAVTAASELAEVHTSKSELQGGVDAAALKGATELQTDQSAATAERARLLADNLANGVKERWTVSTSAQVGSDGRTMTVTQSATRRSLFGNLAPPGGFHISVTASAVSNSTMPLCMLTTMSGAGQDLHLTGSATVHATGCLVQSDSSMQADPAASLYAGAAQAVQRAGGAISPTAVTDAPTMPDPFSSLAISVPTTCSDQGVILPVNATQTLAAGTHCGILQVPSGAVLTLGAGEHYFLNSSINVVGTGEVTGTDVVLVFKGSSAIAAADPGTTLSFNGRQSGPYAGFVLITDRSFTAPLNLAAGNIPSLHGTVYLPAAVLSINMSGSGSAASNSPWTVVIANGIQVEGTTALQINSNYLASNVPVPNGVGPAGGGVQLTR